MDMFKKFLIWLCLLIILMTRASRSISSDKLENATVGNPNRNTQHKLALNENVLWIKVIRAFLVGHFSEGIPKTLKCKWEFSLKTGKFSVKLG